MILHLTKKLADKLKINPLPAPEAAVDDLLSWRANYIQEDGQRFVVIMNDASRFTVVLNNAKADKLKQLPELFRKTLRETLLSLGVNPEVIDKYIAELANITYAKNFDKKRTAQLNKNANSVWWALRNHSSDLELSKRTSNEIFNTSGVDEALIPCEKLLELLAKYELPVRKFRAFDLNVRLDLDGNDATRKLRVPAHITFDHLHRVLQAAFNWQNYHLYSFGMFKEWSENYYARPEVELVMNEDGLEANPEAKLMDGITLSEYLPAYRKVLYTYDYGDDWHHYIELENIIEDCDQDLPLLLAGDGDAPPEDVGGIGGFEDFRKIIADPAHENYQHLTEWANSQLWRPFNFKITSAAVSHRR